MSTTCRILEFPSVPTEGGTSAPGRGDESTCGEVPRSVTPLNRRRGGLPAPAAPSLLPTTPVVIHAEAPSLPNEGGFLNPRAVATEDLVAGPPPPPDREADEAQLVRITQMRLDDVCRHIVAVAGDEGLSAATVLALMQEVATVREVVGAVAVRTPS